MPRTLVQRFVEDVRVVVRNARRPTAEEFDAHVAEAARLLQSTRVVLVVLVGDGAEVVFDSLQRAKLSHAGAFARPHAVLAPALRPEIITGMTWLGATIRSFGPHQLDRACDFLEIAEPVRPALSDGIAAMKIELQADRPATAAAGLESRRVDGGS
jgi:hypothetical protein